MRAMMLGRLPADLAGVRVLDAGCGAGQMTAELAARGADVTAIDISPRLIEIAAARLPEGDRGGCASLRATCWRPNTAPSISSSRWTA